MEPFCHLWISICFVLLQLSPLGSEIVQCVGSDGHSEIEISRLGNCFTCLEEESHETQLEEPFGDHCGVCIDIPLNSPFPSFFGKRISYTPKLVAQPPKLQSCALVQRVKPESEFRNNAFHLIKTSIVLLI